MSIASRYGELFQVSYITRDLDAAMAPADVAADALRALGVTPSTAAGRSNRAAVSMFRGMERRDVIELMSGITASLVPPPAVS